MKTWKQILEVSPPLVRLESGKAIYMISLLGRTFSSRPLLVATIALDARHRPR